MELTYKEQAAVFKALCDEKRLQIIELLKNGERCACVLIEQMGMPQSSLAYHMKILCESGIVVGRQEGKWTHYHICEQGRRRALELLAMLTETTGTADAPEASEFNALCCSALEAKSSAKETLRCKS